MDCLHALVALSLERLWDFFFDMGAGRYIQIQYRSCRATVPVQGLLHNRRCPSLEGASRPFCYAGPSLQPVLLVYHSMLFALSPSLPALFPLATCGKPWSFALQWGPIHPASLQSLDGNRWQRILSGTVCASVIDKTGRLAPSGRLVSPHVLGSCPVWSVACPGAGVYSTVTVRCTMRAANCDLQNGLSLPAVLRFDSLHSPASPSAFVLAWPVLFSGVGLHRFDPQVLLRPEGGLVVPLGPPSRPQS